MSSPQTNSQELVERFLAAFNGIEHELKRRVGAEQSVSFARAVDYYAQRNSTWRFGSILKQYADLRNFIVHNQVAPFERLAIPTLQVVEDIESIRAGFSDKVIPKFQREVAVLTPDSSLAAVLGLVTKYGYSQFPVQQADGQFQGLLTETGITRWLARHTAAVKMSLVEFDDVSVAAVIGEEETKSNYSFVSRHHVVNEAFSLFAKSPLLEAVLITERGRPTEKLMGIITRWDVLTAE